MPQRAELENINTYTCPTSCLSSGWTKRQRREQPSGQTGRQLRRRYRTIVWLQCYAMYVGVMATKSPDMVLELMAYMISIIRASQEYKGLPWQPMTQPTVGKLQLQATISCQKLTHCCTPSALWAKQERLPDATYASAQLTRHPSALWQ